MNVTMPDGTVVTDVPEGTTQTQLSSRYSAYKTPSPSEPQVQGALGTTGTSMNAKTGMAFTSPTDEDASNVVKTAATSIPAAVLNAGKTVGELETGQKDSGGLDAEVTSFNKSREDWMQGNPAAKLADVAGQAAIPLAGTEGAVAKVGGWFKQGLSALAARTGARAAVGAAQGATVEAEQPHDNQSRQQILDQEGNAATVGGGLSLGMGAAGGVVKALKTAGRGLTSDTAAEQDVGKYLDKNVDMSQVEQHLANPAAKDMTVPQITQDPDLVSAQKALATGPSKNEVNVRTQDTQSQIAKEIEANTGILSSSQNHNLNISTPTATDAQASLGAKVRDTNIAKQKEYNDAYDAVAPDDAIKAPINTLQDKFDEIRNAHSDVIHGSQGETPQESSPADKQLSEIDNRYSNENGEGEAEEGDRPQSTASVKQMIQDKNNLGKYISNSYKQLKSPVSNLTADQQTTVLQKITAAQQMRDALRGHLSSLNNVPSAVTGKSVGQAYNEAEGKYQAYQKDFLENPNQYKANDKGQPYNYSSSAIGDIADRQNKGSAGSLAEEGANALPLNNPKALGDALDNFKNLEGAEGHLSDNLRAQIADKGVDAVLTPEVESVLNAKGFGNVVKQVKTEGVLNDMRSNIAEQPNKLGAGNVTTIDYDKALDTWNNHKDFLKTSLPAAQYNALDSLHTELAQSSFAQRSAASAASPIEGNLGDKMANTVIKGALSKISGIPIGTASSTTLILSKIKSERLTRVTNEALANPEYALKLYNAAKASPKDPTILQKTVDTLWKALPAAAAANPNHNDKTLQNEINQQTPKSNIDSEVKDVTKSAQSSNSNFSLVSDADAAEFPGAKGGEVPLFNSPVDSKKNDTHVGEYQIADAAQATGMPKEYFSAVEKAETQGTNNPNTARPIDKVTGKPKSTAYGRGQFTESTWNEMSDKHGLPPVTDDNRYTSDDPRSNPKYSRLAIGYYGAENAAKLTPWLQDKFNRVATVGDTYGAHLMGLSGFKQFLSASPSAKADTIVPAAAKNNKSLFYDDNGKALSVKQVYHNMEDRLMPANSSNDNNNNNEPDMSP